jgi:hypothetical protein
MKPLDNEEGYSSVHEKLYLKGSQRRKELELEVWVIWSDLPTYAIIERGASKRIRKRADFYTAGHP